MFSLSINAMLERFGSWVAPHALALSHEKVFRLRTVLMWDQHIDYIGRAYHKRFIYKILIQFLVKAFRLGHNWVRSWGGRSFVRQFLLPPLRWNNLSFLLSYLQPMCSGTPFPFVSQPSTLFIWKIEFQFLTTTTIRRRFRSRMILDAISGSEH